MAIEFAEKNGFYRINLIPISVLEIFELISLKTFLVFNVDANEYDGLKALSLTEMVDKYSAYLKKFDDETLLMDKENVIQLLDEIYHYNFCLIDVESEINVDKIIQIIDLADKWNEITVVEETSSNLFISSHDDCYSYIETTDKNLAFNLIALQIKTLATTISDCSVNEFNFDTSEIITESDFSIVIPQTPIKISEKVSWKILVGTFKDFVYSNKMPEYDKRLVLDKATNEIKLKKSEAIKTSD